MSERREEGGGGGGGADFLTESRVNVRLVALFPTRGFVRTGRAGPSGASEELR
jgi:hypothetical protein